MSVAFFDLDRTLLDVNSGQLWLVHEWRGGHITTRDALVGVYWLTRYALGESSMDTALDRACSVYAGVPEATLRERIEAWFAADVAHHARPGGLAALQAHREAGDRVVLATSGSQYAAECARRTFDLDDAISTVVECRDGVMTGRVASYGIGVHKLHACRAWAEAEGVALEDCAFYTDSHSDLALLEAVGRPVIVAPDRPLARVAASRGWPVVDWGSAG